MFVSSPFYQIFYRYIVAGVSTSNAQKSFDMLLKTQYITEKIVAEDLNLPTPKNVTGKPIIDVSPAIDFVRGYINQLADRAEELKNHLDSLGIKQNHGYFILCESDNAAVGINLTAPSTFVVWEKAQDGGYINGLYEHILLNERVAN